MRSWLGFHKQEGPPIWVIASLPSDIWSWEEQHHARNQALGKKWGLSQEREMCYRFGVVSSSYMPASVLVNQPRSMWKTHAEATLAEKQIWPDEHIRWCTSSSGVAGKEEKHLDKEVSFRSWPLTWLLQPSLAPYSFLPDTFKYFMDWEVIRSK